MAVNVKYVDNIAEVYDLGERLGSGTYGTVYAARKKWTAARDGRVDAQEEEAEKIVVKLVQRKGDYVRELDHLVSSRQCGKVLPLRQALLTDSQLCMEFRRGECTLWEFITKHRAGKTPDQILWESLGMTADILATLAHMHDRGIAHRDLKAENVMVLMDNTGRAVPYIIDFGMSKRIGVGRHDVSDYEIVTSSYRAPELWRTLRGPPFDRMFTGDQDLVLETDSEGSYGPGSDEYERLSASDSGGKMYDHKVDVWSAGCLLYEMLTGKRPFYATTGREDVRSRIGGHIQHTVGPCIEYEGVFPVPATQEGMVDLARDVMTALYPRPVRRASTTSVPDRSSAAPSRLTPAHVLGLTLTLMASLLHPRAKQRCTAHQAREMLNFNYHPESRNIDDDTMKLMIGTWSDYREIDGHEKNACLNELAIYAAACDEVSFSPRVAFLSVYIWVRSLCLGGRNIIPKYSRTTLLIASIRLAISYTGSIKPDPENAGKIKAILRSRSQNAHAAMTAEDRAEQKKREGYAQCSILTLLGGRIWSTNPGDLRKVHLKDCTPDQWNPTVDPVIMDQMCLALKSKFAPPSPEEIISNTIVSLHADSSSSANGAITRQFIARTITELDDLMNTQIVLE